MDINMPHPLEANNSDSSVEKFNVPKDADTAIRDSKNEERSFMEKLKLATGITTEARLGHERKLDFSKNEPDMQQRNLNESALQILKEATREGEKNNNTFVDFMKRYGVNNPLANTPTEAMVTVLAAMVDDPNKMSPKPDIKGKEWTMIDAATQFAKNELLKSTPKQPAPSPDLTPKGKTIEQMVAQIQSKIKKPAKKVQPTEVASSGPIGQHNWTDVGQASTLPANTFSATPEKTQPIKPKVKSSAVARKEKK